MWVTKESDALYQLLAGRTEPQPGSLPQNISFLEIDGIETVPDEAPGNAQEIEPLLRLSDWLDEQKEQIQRSAKTAESLAEVVLIDRIQTKIQELLE